MNGTSEVRTRVNLKVRRLQHRLTWDQARLILQLIERISKIEPLIIDVQGICGKRESIWIKVVGRDPF